MELTQASGRDVLLVERFDRHQSGRRRMMVSALTILELHDADGMAGRYGSYAALADRVRARFTDSEATLRELFSRIVFNVLVGNTDDHPRNHAAFWDGEELTLTPAYDICPQRRIGGEAAQAMAYGGDGERLAQVGRCMEHVSTFHLSPGEGREIVDQQVSIIQGDWIEVCNLARLPPVDRDRLWGRQILNSFALEGL